MWATPSRSNSSRTRSGAVRRVFAPLAVVMLGSASVFALGDSRGVSPALHKALEDGDVGAVAALVEDGVDVEARACDLCDETLLHVAVAAGDVTTVTLLLQVGANVNARTAAHWTPLHLALEHQPDAGESVIVSLLMEAGADVNGATALAGWTPLHLVAERGREMPDIMAAMIDRGADVNARTRFGGWTPLHLAMRRDRSSAFLAVLRAAGALDERLPASAFPPVLVYGDEYEVVDGFPDWDDRPLHKIEVDDLYHLGDSDPGSGDYAVEGAFTGPDEKELLVVERFGGRVLLGEFDWTHLFGLIDGDGRHRILWLSNTDYTFQTLCRDPASGVNHAIFLSTGDGGSCCPGDIVYMYYDPESETMVPGLVEEHVAENVHARMRGERLRWNEYATSWTPPLHGAPKEAFNAVREVISSWPTPDGVCRWREKEAALASFYEAIVPLSVGRRWASADDVIPSRQIEAAVVDAKLAQLGRLPPDVVSLHTVESSDWTVVTVDGHKDGNIKYDDGVALVHDKQRRVWHSILDCDKLYVDELAENTLSGRIVGCDDGSAFPDVRRVSVDLLALGTK